MYRSLLGQFSSDLIGLGKWPKSCEFFSPFITEPRVRRDVLLPKLEQISILYPAQIRYYRLHATGNAPNVARPSKKKCLGRAIRKEKKEAKKAKIAPWRPIAAFYTRLTHKQVRELMGRCLLSY